jgi:transcriptional regulator with GAF, ATPase, and Fis domain
LITGPSGTGKELVARAIGMSGYQAFDSSSMTFEGDDSPIYTEMNLSALPANLVESELFGHAKGAFTGALKDRIGRLEACPAQGSIFIDEIGEIDESIQVKLLRVLQERTFQRVGENGNRKFMGKCLVATNRDLEHEIQQGTFRRDLYYRLCSDQIRTPSLRSILQSEPEELLSFLHYIAKKSLPDEACEAPVREAETWIRENLPEDYPWHGNFRELEQCFNNLLIRGDYQPSTLDSASESDPWLFSISKGDLTADELLNVYCQRLHDKLGSFEEAGRALGIDPRTVKSRALKA